METGAAAVNGVTTQGNAMTQKVWNNVPNLGSLGTYRRLRKHALL